MKSLEKIIAFEMIKVPDFTMDHFQAEIRDNLHLEFFFEKGRVIITPELDYMIIGDATDQEIDDISNLLAAHSGVIEKIKSYLMYNLSLYSALLETNSYYITLNNHLLISRFLMLDDESHHFEIKLYTINRVELPGNYKDKIYLGRDLLSLRRIHRDYFGLKFIHDSLNEQIKKLKGRIAEFVPGTDRFELEQEYLSDVESLVKEFSESSQKILSQFPADLTSADVETEALVKVNRYFRDLKHILIEVEGALSEIETRMFQKDLNRAVRYVTKFKKDITNDINYIMFKINGRISDYVNDIHI